MQLELHVRGVGVDAPPALLRALDVPQEHGILTTGDGVAGRGVNGESEIDVGS